MSPLEILKASLALIEGFGNWTAGKLARDRRGEHVGVGSKEACKFCAMGAVLRASGEVDTDVLIRGDTAVAKAYGYLVDEALAAFSLTVVTVNDSCGHSDTVKMFKGAIARAEEAEKSNSETTTGA